MPTPRAVFVTAGVAALILGSTGCAGTKAQSGPAPTPPMVSPPPSTAPRTPSPTPSKAAPSGSPLQQVVLTTNGSYRLKIDMLPGESLKHAAAVICTKRQSELGLQLDLLAAPKYYVQVVDLVKSASDPAPKPPANMFPLAAGHSVLVSQRLALCGVTVQGND